MPDYSYEIKAQKAGFCNICGVDEAGRGPLAGPVFAAAVVLPEGLVIDGLNDSKKLSEKKREQLFDIICEKAVSFSIASASVEEIEEFNILNAAMLAMERAVKSLPKVDYAIIDGNRIPDNLSVPAEAVIGGDGLSMSVAAASVLAKVSRDRLMRELDAFYPQYDFKKHKGYGTAEHRRLIKEYGPSPVHRPSFLKKIL